MGKFAHGKFTLKNPQKYVGTKTPTYRSSWEFMFMKSCDEHPSIIHWASESLRIPYKCPITGKSTVYVPDFLIEYNDKDNKKHIELIEIKPSTQHILEKVGKNKNNQIQFTKNQAKWAAAEIWCNQKGLKFRVVNENDLFHQGKKRK
jgi:hypothetical protein